VNLHNRVMAKAKQASQAVEGRSTMPSAVSERLSDLESACVRLRAVIDAEKPDALPPGMVLARIAVATDKAANCLAGYLEQLAEVSV
jgi:hypothetical protein